MKYVYLISINLEIFVMQSDGDAQCYGESNLVIFVSSNIFNEPKNANVALVNSNS